MVLRQPRAEVCNSNPGSLEDLIVTVKAETLIEWNLRRVTFDELVGTGRIVLEGPPRLAKAFSTWLRPSPFADQPATR
jgi:hypothetical protein